MIVNSPNQRISRVPLSRKRRKLPERSPYMNLDDWPLGAMELAFDQYEEATSQVIVYLPELAHHANHKLIAAKVGGKFHGATDPRRVNCDH